MRLPQAIAPNGDPYFDVPDVWFKVRVCIEPFGTLCQTVCRSLDLNCTKEKKKKKKARQLV